MSGRTYPHDVTAIPVRRRLSDTEIASVLNAIDTAASSADLYIKVLTTMFDILLGDDGRTLATADAPIDPRGWQIPTSQWQAILTAAGNRAQQWGTTAELGLNLLDRLPGGYDDADVPAPQVTLRDWRPYVHQVHLSREATDVITAATQHVDALGNYFGTTSATYLRAARSWLAQLTRMLSMNLGAESHISRDSDLSLLVHTSSGLTYGILFHEDRRHCNAGEGCSAYLDEHGTAHAQSSCTVIAGHVHIPSYPLDAPRPGEWMFHS